MFTHYLDLAWRSLRSTPLPSALMTLAIAIGIGVTMVSLSVYHMMSANPLPDKSSQLFAVQLMTMDDGDGFWTKDNLPYQLTHKDSTNLMNMNDGFKKVAMFRSGFAVYKDSDGTSHPTIQDTRLTTRGFFDMFAVPFLHGSVWSEQQGKDAAPVVVIDAVLAKQLFGRTDVVGEDIFLETRQYQVVGVIDEWQPHIKMYDLNNGNFNDAERVFIPFSHSRAYSIDTWGNTNGWKYENIRNFNDKLNSEMFWTQLWIELPNEQAKERYGVQLMGYMQEQMALGRFTREELKYGLKDLEEWLEYNDVVTEDNKILIGLSFMFLVVCLANILGLLLAKFLKRAPDVGVRRALGASKRQVFYQHLVEVALLGGIGGIFGIGFAQLGLWGIRQSYSYYEVLATMDITMLLAAPTIAIITCIIAGLYPAWLVCRTSPATYLKVQ
ncbi:ABC transporter permease (plasmid) [Pseudoalteromonas sp. T1lg65]|uniref:ABC transporter permease n=1 Tax=Pseudoalteromonas sp. T1lg65 TaxID=2077101 RepID=UPI003F7AA304